MKKSALNKVADDLQIVPHFDTLTAIMADMLRREGKDASLAPIWAEKLRYTYTKPLETPYPDLKAANGDVLPIDTSVPPAALIWEYFMIDQAGYADWIDDEGKVMPSSSLTAKRFTGQAAEMGHRWDLNKFDLERAAMAGVAIDRYKQEAAKRAHDALTNWTWLFGDSSKDLPGLCTHPNISVTLAPLNGGSSSRLWANKSNAEILEDLALLIDTVPSQTMERYHVAKVFLPFDLMRECRNRLMTSSSTPIAGTMSLWDYIKELYSGDDTGQGKITFMTLNECDAARRLHPKTNTDDSGITGDFIIAISAMSKDEAAFMRMRPYTQLPPQEEDFSLKVLTHSKIGGCKLQVPTAVHRLDFGVT